MSRFSSWRGEFAEPLQTLQRELNKLIEEYWTGGPAAEPGGKRPDHVWAPAVDVFESADAIVVLADLPGVAADAVELSVTGRNLSLKGVREEPLDAGQPATRLHRQERVRGKFSREIPLPSDVDMASPQAELRDGVLRVKLAKGESARPRNIPVQMP